MSDAAPLLVIDNLEAYYGDFKALFGISLQVCPGQVVAMIGANGAGKSTLMRCISGMMSTSRAAIKFDGEEIGGMPAYQMLSRGIAMVPEGRRLFPSLSVEENLIIGGQIGRKGTWNLNRIYELFPMLFERRHHPATTLSGGQQQMVAIGRALMSNPVLLLCDELSLGLAPIIVREIYGHLRTIIAEGTSALIVEQDIMQALKISDHVYCMQEGRIALEGPAAKITREDIAAAYFGV
jgi:branched-chain amino acid transport system ATP-binding protein